jgi:hypothetical protein
VDRGGRRWLLEKLQGKAVLRDLRIVKRGGLPMACGGGRNRGLVVGGLPVQRGGGEGLDERNGVPFYRCAP